jgi:hypothetical protein
MLTTNAPSFSETRRKVIEALNKKPETKTEWERLINAAEDMMKIGGAQ